MGVHSASLRETVLGERQRVKRVSSLGLSLRASNSFFIYYYYFVLCSSLSNTGQGSCLDILTILGTSCLGGSLVSSPRAEAPILEGSLENGTLHDSMYGPMGVP